MITEEHDEELSDIMNGLNDDQYTDVMAEFVNEYRNIIAENSQKIIKGEQNQYADIMAKFLHEHCDIVTENGQRVMKFKGDPKSKDIKYIRGNVWVKEDPKNRRYMGLNTHRLTSGMRFYKDLQDVNTINSIAIPLDIKNDKNNTYYHARFHPSLGLFIMDDQCAPVTSVFAETVLNKLKDIQDKEKKAEEENRKNFDFDKFINDFNGDKKNDNKDKEKKGQTACQKKQRKKKKKREENIKKLEEEEKKKQIAENQKKLKEEEEKKQKQELERQQQFKNKWRRMKEGVVDYAKIKDTKAIVNNLKNNQMKKNAEQKIKDMAIKKNENTFTNNLKTIATDTNKHLQQEKEKKKYHKSFINYVEKPNYKGTTMQSGLAGAQKYYSDSISSIIDDYINNNTNYTKLNLNSKPYKPKNLSRY